MQPTEMVIWLSFEQQSITVMQILGLWPFTETSVTRLLEKLKISFKKLDSVDSVYREQLTATIIADRDDSRDAVDALANYIRSKIGDAGGKIEVAAREFIKYREYYDNMMLWDYVITI